MLKEVSRLLNNVFHTILIDYFDDVFYYVNLGHEVCYGLVIVIMLPDTKNVQYILLYFRICKYRLNQSIFNLIIFLY